MLWGYRRGSTPLVGTVVARDTQNDLALISVDSQLPAVAPFRQTPIRAGEDVIALGFPLPGLLAADLNVSKGIVSATAGLLDDSMKLQISVGVQPGNSGGPLIDSAGLVAGVVLSKLDALVMAKRSVTSRRPLASPSKARSLDRCNVVARQSHLQVPL